MDLDISFNLLHIEHKNNSYPTLRERKAILLALKKGLQNEATALADAVSSDFTHRSQTETLFLEIFPTIQAINYCLHRIKYWMKKRRRKVSWLLFPAKAYLMPQPLGVVGIIVPWNYPVYLALVPALYALAAGNRVMIKISELTPTVGLILESMIKSLSLSDYIVVVNGGLEVSREFSSLPFGHLIFTGSPKVGKEVMKTASERLTPVTLELGGKSPAILSQTMRSNYFNRLFMGKFFNAGQTCIAPDYLFIPSGWENRVEEQLKTFVQQHYPRLIDNENYTSIINESHTLRLLDLVEDARSKGARVVEFGSPSEDKRKLPMYLLFDVHPSMRVMSEEIFGPILPVLTYSAITEVIDAINKAPNPLAIYYFGHDKKEMQQIQKRTLSGALTFNDTLMQVAVDDLPFGGVGNSGMGHYHGQEGFDTCSKLKAIMVQKRMSPISWLYPPYGALMRLFLSLVGGIKLK